MKTPPLALILSTLLCAYSASPSPDTIYVEGFVDAGNYSVYVIKENVPVKLTLSSISGDADLYISDVNPNPSFDFDAHNGSAVSCGIDEIDIGFEYGRPVYVSVYGHPRYQTSHYFLEMSALEVSMNHYEHVTSEYEDILNANDPEENRDQQPNVKAQSQKTSQSHESHDENAFWHILWDILKSILHIMLEIAAG